MALYLNSLSFEARRETYRENRGEGKEKGESEKERVERGQRKERGRKREKRIETREKRGE